MFIREGVLFGVVCGQKPIWRVKSTLPERAVMIQEIGIQGFLHIRH
jgi:hypothetical protein